MEETTRRFRAMNTDVLATIVIDTAGQREDAAVALDELEQLFARVEACASRFRPESELSALNRAAGRPFAASPLLYDLVRAALQAAAETDGAFDPTLLDALEQAGYDRSFEQLAASGAAPDPPGPRPTSVGPLPGAWRAVRLDPATQTITLPPGCRIDLGGIGKGWTVDQACALLYARGFRHFAVDAGGDLYATGTTGDGEPWTVGVCDPANPERDLAVLTLDGNGVATSTIARRRWYVGSELRHHLIDPRTRRPATSGIVSATVMAETVARAEVLAKAALILGPTAGRALLDRLQVAGLLVTVDGAMLHAGPPVFMEIV